MMICKSKILLMAAGKETGFFALWLRLGRFLILQSITKHAPQPAFVSLSRQFVVEHCN
jgi:hypothetical protein